MKTLNVGRCILIFRIDGESMNKLYREDALETQTTRKAFSVWNSVRATRRGNYNIHLRPTGDGSLFRCRQKNISARKEFAGETNVLNINRLTGKEGNSVVSVEFSREVSPRGSKREVAGRSSRGRVRYPFSFEIWISAAFWTANSQDAGESTTESKFTLLNLLPPATISFLRRNGSVCSRISWLLREAAPTKNHASSSIH